MCRPPSVRLLVVLAIATIALYTPAARSQPPELPPGDQEALKLVSAELSSALVAKDVPRASAVFSGLRLGEIVTWLEAAVPRATAPSTATFTPLYAFDSGVVTDLELTAPITGGAAVLRRRVYVTSSRDGTQPRVLTEQPGEVASPVAERTPDTLFAAEFRSGAQVVHRELFAKTFCVFLTRRLAPGWSAGIGYDFRTVYAGSLQSDFNSIISPVELGALRAAAWRSTGDQGLFLRGGAVLGLATPALTLAPDPPEVSGTILEAGLDATIGYAGTRAWAALFVTPAWSMGTLKTACANCTVAGPSEVEVSRLYVHLGGAVGVRF